jgi:hypothetical protein
MPPPISQFKSLLAKAEKAAKESGLRKEDLEEVIAQSRKSKAKNLID